TPERIAVRGGSMSRIAIPRISPGLPSELLLQRPDIREAEAKLAATEANVESARAALFPSISLTGQAGFQSAQLTTLLTTPAAVYTIAASVAQPVFDGYRLLGSLDLQKGLRAELLQIYRKTVLTGFADVERGLIAIQELGLQERL